MFLEKKTSQNLALHTHTRATHTLWCKLQTSQTSYIL